MKKRFIEEQIIGILRQAEADGVVIRDLCRKHNITEQTFFRWRNKYNGMTVPEARRLKDLEAENAKLKKLLAEQLLAIECLAICAKPAKPAAENVWRTRQPLAIRIGRMGNVLPSLCNRGECSPSSKRPGIVRAGSTSW
jgi:putative transposase